MWVVLLPISARLLKYIYYVIQTPFLPLTRSFPPEVSSPFFFQLRGPSGPFPAHYTLARHGHLTYLPYMGIHFPNESFGLLLSFHPPSKDQGDAEPPFPAKNTALARPVFTLVSSSLFFLYFSLNLILYSRSPVYV